MEAKHPARVEREPWMREQKTRNRFLAILTVLLVIWGLRVSASVTLPLAIALFLVALFWPLQHRMQQRMGRGLAAGLTLICFLIVVGLFVLALWFAIDQVTQKWPQYSDQFQQLLESVKQTAQEFGVSLSNGGQGGSQSVSQGSVFRISTQLVSIVGAFFLILAYLIFGLVEVRDYRTKLDTSLGGGQGTRWIEVARKISSDFQRFVVVRGSVALFTGFLVFIFSTVTGLDFALIWGLITFVLEFIPTVGTFVSMVPPMLFALFQFGSTGKVILILVGLGTIQFVMGNVIEPLVEGKYLHLSPLVILISIAFWAWVWGVAGAFMALPITMFIAIACQHFERTRWIAILLSNGDGQKLKKKG